MRKSGFTLMELLIIIVIIATLSVLALPVFHMFVSDAKEAVAEQQREEPIRIRDFGNGVYLFDAEDRYIHMSDYAARLAQFRKEHPTFDVVSAAPRHAGHTADFVQDMLVVVREQ